MIRRIIFSFALALGACISSAQESRPPAAGLHGYTEDPAWPKKPAEIAWGDVPGVAVDAKDNVWIFTRHAPNLQVYSPGGELIRTWPGLEHKMAHHIKIDAAGNVWLADVGLHTVRQFSPEGKLLRTLGTPGEKGEDQTHLNMPTDMAVAPSGDVFVSDGYGNNRVVHFDRDGRFVKAWGKLGAAPGEFNIPHAICMDSKGRLYVADRSNARIQVFEQSGAFVEEWRNLLVPWGLWITTKDEIWACGSSPTLHHNAQGMTGIPPEDQVLMRFATSGKLLELWCPKLGVEGEHKPGETCWVHAVAVDSKGNLYTGDIKGRRLQKFVPAR